MTPTVVGNPTSIAQYECCPTGVTPLGQGLNDDSMGQRTRQRRRQRRRAMGVGPGEGYGTGGGPRTLERGGYGTPRVPLLPAGRLQRRGDEGEGPGVVELIAIITPDGRVTDVHLAKGLGLGLDEKAIEAVRTWRLKPALRARMASPRRCGNSSKSLSSSTDPARGRVLSRPPNSRLRHVNHLAHIASTRASLLLR